MNTTQWKMNSVIGPLYLVASDRGLQGVFWKKREAPMAKNLESSGIQVRILAKAVHQLEQYFTGKRKVFDLPLDPSGTEFQRRVWDELGRIPYGRTVSYKDIARKIKNENAMRAVGTANGRNPLAVIVPCHRVIAADGTLGGYAGGLAIKSHLLAIETAAGSS